MAVLYCHCWICVFLGLIPFSVLLSHNLNVDGGCGGKLCQGMKITHGLEAAGTCCVYPDPTAAHNSSVYVHPL